MARKKKPPIREPPRPILPDEEPPGHDKPPIQEPPPFSDETGKNPPPIGDPPRKKRRAVMQSYH